MRKKVDGRIRTLVENGIKTHTRSMFVIVGDRGRDQVVNLHFMMHKIANTKPSVLWCYKKELGFSTHRKKRMKQLSHHSAMSFGAKTRLGRLVAHITAVPPLALNLPEEGGLPHEALEIFDIYETLPDPAQLQTSLLDIDKQALELIAASAEERHLTEHLRLRKANLIHLALGRRSVDVQEQDLVYTIGLIDYFDDDMVVKLLSLAYDMLRPGGRVIVGNFHTSNPDKAFMDYVMEWPLVHRDEAKMHALFKASKFGKPCDQIQFEAAGVNLFAECSRFLFSSVKKMQQRGQLDANVEDPFDLFISSTNIRYCYYKETEQVLGKTFGMCILQDFEALTPNLLCRVVETVEGGGIVLLLTADAACA
ncbi:UPF0202 protein C20G8.09c [Symbiodinium microadriaticum]|uniref:UPF0202 protein C20G8.09c n=1 Tax=Symbiodinium microadriaticum TaxID=2951 RepID=A0A1Q9E1T3_SYMMI|nr:UPF0202 protein C20G8.09c [Symbiodinium microadriaticum]